MGHLHFKPEPLTNEEAKQLIEKGERCVLSMDYVKGRACKMDVRQEGDKLTISDTWYDHTDRIYQRLLDCFDIKRDGGEKEHGCACNCIDCQLIQSQRE